MPKNKGKKTQKAHGAVSKANIPQKQAVKKAVPAQPASKIPGNVQPNASIPEKTAETAKIGSPPPTKLDELREMESALGAPQTQQAAQEAPIERVRTGIEGFDELMDGGIPKGSLVLVAGQSGTGKSMFSFGFAYYGAKFGETSIYLSLEEDPEEIVKRMKRIGCADIEQLLNDGKLIILQGKMYEFEELVDTIRNTVESSGAKRFVLDSVSLLGIFFEKPYELRRGIMLIASMLKLMGCTAIFTSEIPGGSQTYSTYGVEEFAADGIVALFHKVIGNIFVRAVSIVKMRGTSHSDVIHPVRLTGTGFKIYPTETLPEGFNIR